MERDFARSVYVEWLHRIKAASAKSGQVKGSNYVSLSTSDCVTGEPRCRMVVFRGWYSDEGRNQGKEKTETTTTSGDDGTAETGGIAVPHVMLKMVTDARSSKVRMWCCTRRVIRRARRRAA